MPSGTRGTLAFIVENFLCIFSSLQRPTVPIPREQDSGTVDLKFFSHIADTPERDGPQPAESTFLSLRFSRID